MQGRAFEKGPGETPLGGTSGGTAAENDSHLVLSNRTAFPQQVLIKKIQTWSTMGGGREYPSARLLDPTINILLFALPRLTIYPPFSPGELYKEKKI